MILPFILGIIVGLLAIPLIMILQPNKIKKETRKPSLNLSLTQKNLISKSLLACTDLNWLNVLISRFWLELSESQAQAYRLKSYMSKWFEMANLNIIKNIEIVDVDIDREAPVVESIRVVTPEEVEEMGLKRDGIDKNGDEKIDCEKKDCDLKNDNMTLKKNINHNSSNYLNQTSSNYLNQTSSNDQNHTRSNDLNHTSLNYGIHNRFNNLNHNNTNVQNHATFNDQNRFFENIFNNVNTLLKIKYEGQIIIKMKIHPFNNFTFNINVHITKVEGQVLLRLPSLDNNSKIEYTFISQPKIDISVDAGLSRNEGKQYLKTSLSNFIRRTIRFFIYKFFVYPSFNNLALPLITPNFTRYLHKITKVTNNLRGDLIENMKKSLNLICLMDYKFLETFKGITISKNNHLINEKDKIARLNFPIPERSLNLKTQRKIMYEGLSIKESKILNFIHDLEIFKEVFPSFKKIFTKFNFDHRNSSLIEIHLSKNTYEYVRIIDQNTIYFQKNDEEDPEFIIFKIYNKQLFIYYFVNKELNFTKKRMSRLIGVFNDKPQSKLISFYNLLKLPREAYKYFRKKNVKDESLRVNFELKDEDDKNVGTKKPDSDKLKYKDDPFEDNSLIDNNITEIFTKYISNPNLLELRKILSFDYPPFLIKKILTEEIRLRLLSESPKIYKERSNKFYKSLAIENPEEDGKDFIMHTSTKDNVIMDVVNGSKFIFVLEEVRKLSNLENVSFMDIHKISQETKRVDHARLDNIGIFNDNRLDNNGLDNNGVDNPDNNELDINNLDNNGLDANKLDNNGINNGVSNKVSYRTDINRQNNDAFRSMDNNFQFKSVLDKNDTRPFTHDINPTFNCKSRLKIYSDTEYGKNYLLESIHTRLRHQELLSLIQNHEFTKIEISKSIKRSFCGDTGGVFIEFKTLEPDDFRLILLEQSKKVFLDIHKIITTRPFVLLLPISNFTLKLYPKYKINNFLELKMVNLPFKYANESLINCDIGLNRNQKFLFPFLVSDNRNDLIIYWEKEESVSGYLRNKETTVEIKGNGNIRADKGVYSIIYKNNGKKKRNIKIYMGCTRKGM